MQSQMRPATVSNAALWTGRVLSILPEESEIEIRQVFEADDFGDEFTPELRKQEARIRAEAQKQQR